MVAERGQYKLRSMFGAVEIRRDLLAGLIWSFGESGAPGRADQRWIIITVGMPTLQGTLATSC